ncbi:nuclear transport factor 2 family protein [Photobacterium kishitanii]|uniref:nuclear transport factor 2 family protein n=1 Tax=Photobacterium kishitanii TaxID=318456 RepID=UPI0005D3F842|nr:nuclear transport factor 2 family protein [Photobacterium kishitanii]KJG10782.1 transcriptional regulator [Photobacterium kishitanii]PSU20543.1 nuclear transport factor 2 family protein [Photobacterium kishitanii]PSV08131.1 nuclear transport factor 2 family protein [Photobacterium kishitanii]PSV75517.1 nuclear transport factor 2 family protein [Photobacterium kishitanii]
MVTTNNMVINTFIEVYCQLNKDNLLLLDDVYHSDIVFEDPAHKIIGLAALHQYFGTLYRNINECTFVINQAVVEDNHAFLQWTMRFSHPRLQQGKQRTLEGCTQLTIEQQRIIYHRDFFDLGAMLYEGLPIIGGVIKHIKARLGQ